MELISHLARAAGRHASRAPLRPSVAAYRCASIAAPAHHGRRHRLSGVQARQISLTSSAAPTSVHFDGDLKEINSLLSEVRRDTSATSMPTRLTPVRTWAEEHRRRGMNTNPSTLDRNRPELLEAMARFEATQLKPKNMQDSLVEMRLNFSKDPELTERYIATSGMIRLGKIFEDLDTLAGAASYLHALGHLPVRQDQGSPIFVVTASVDRLDLLKPLSIASDYRLTGSVIYVGSSSMEVMVAIEEVTPTSQVCLTGRFTMAARNAVTLKSQKIAPLSLETEAERQLFEMGQKHKESKRIETAASLEKLPPSKEEAQLLHTIYLRDREALASFGSHAYPNKRTAEDREEEEVVTLASTTQASTIHMHPQQANVHLNVFGGVLMRQSYELSWITAAMFANQPVEFLALDALSFHSPVPIGAVISMTSTVTYTSNGEKGWAQEGGSEDGVVAAVNTLVEIVDIATGKRKKSNTFHFSFRLSSIIQQQRKPAAAQHHALRRVAPLTYAEAIEWLESRRRVKIGDQIRHSAGR